MSLFRRKSLDSVTVHEAGRRLIPTLSWPHLIALGIGAIVGTGIYTLIGVGANLAYGLQHVLTMYVGIVAVPLIVGQAAGLSAAEIGLLIAASLFAGGAATLLQTLGLPFFGCQLPLLALQRPQQSLHFAVLSSSRLLLLAELSAQRLQALAQAAAESGLAGRELRASL